MEGPPQVNPRTFYVSAWNMEVYRRVLLSASVQKRTSSCVKYVFGTASFTRKIPGESGKPIPNNVSLSSSIIRSHYRTIAHEFRNLSIMSSPVESRKTKLNNIISLIDDLNEKAKENQVEDNHDEEIEKNDLDFSI